MVWRMTLVATAVEPAHIGDRRVRTLGLDLERRDQSVFRSHHDPVALAFQTDADGELRLHWRLSHELGKVSLHHSPGAPKARSAHERLVRSNARCPYGRATAPKRRGFRLSAFVTAPASSRQQAATRQPHHPA